MKRVLLLGASLVSACLCCVARGTRIRTPKGDRPVEDLGPGDDLFCLDPDTRELVAAKLHSTRTAKRECLSLDALVCTSDHPLWCPDTREWAPAGDWALGRRTRLLRADGPVRVQRVSTFAGVHDVFDLTVDHPLHNFIADGVLVHNKSPPIECTPESAVFDTTTTCGPPTTLSITLDPSCQIVAGGAAAGNLPSRGFANGSLARGFSLDGIVDGGMYWSCEVGGDNGSIACTPSCTNLVCDRDAGPCSGTVTRR